jgi:hypothetical protein
MELPHISIREFKAGDVATTGLLVLHEAAHWRNYDNPLHQDAWCGFFPSNKNAHFIEHSKHDYNKGPVFVPNEPKGERIVSIGGGVRVDSYAGPEAIDDFLFQFRQLPLSLAIAVKYVRLEPHLNGRGYFHGPKPTKEFNAITEDVACTTELAYVMASAPESVRARIFIKMLDEKSVL